MHVSYAELQILLATTMGSLRISGGHEIFTYSAAHREKVINSIHNRMELLELKLLDPDDCEECQGLGWGIFDSDIRGLEIQKCDLCGKFPDDETALRHARFFLATGIRRAYFMAVKGMIGGMQNSSPCGPLYDEMKERWDTIFGPWDLVRMRVGPNGELNQVRFRFIGIDDNEICSLTWTTEKEVPFDEITKEEKRG